MACVENLVIQLKKLAKEDLLHNGPIEDSVATWWQRALCDLSPLIVDE